MITQRKLYEAIDIANKKHRGQMRKCGMVPYIVHPMHVLGILYKYGITNDKVLSAAVLHDVVEDTDMSILDIQSAFGWDVRRIVEALTKPDGDYTKQKESRIIKMADRLSNISRPFPENWDSKKQLSYLKEGIEIAENGRNDLAPLSVELCDECIKRIDLLP